MTETTVPYIWCLVGNIIENRFYGENKLIRKGTKKFTPSTKVYCFPALWGDGYEEIQVIGKLRGRKNLGIVITSSKYITNWRLQKIFNPYVIRTMTERNGWDGAEESREIIEAMLEWLPSRTMKVSDHSLNKRRTLVQ
ncbi:hypothetical protein [Paenibacillus glycanilyticus]|uniref:hypothetical protein n=1 Tax=Paenibacillus glycanilyticus TaxID=126569 RepID=UPI0019110A63|nr:hypothetical protein [Paenibacillus glycanilyticus]